MHHTFRALALFLLSAASLTAESSPLELRLPTNNAYIFSNNPEKFYMYTPRNFEGVESRPWTAGNYGFVRNLRRVPEGVIATQFHEGIDIRPMLRDQHNRPLDVVSAIADGTVVYTNTRSGNSNYGNYVVVKHDWQQGPFFSLYAHLESISCKVGEQLSAGSPLGKMGYTGAGLNRERAHLHLELNILDSAHFDQWHNDTFHSKNHHGLYNGLNMSGLNIAELFIRHNNNPNISLTHFISQIPVYYKVTIPRKHPLELAQRYAWLCKGDHTTESPSWEISFASSGFPLAITPSMRSVNKPTVSYVEPTQSNHSYYTKGIITGSGKQATLSKLGLGVINLMTQKAS